MNDKRRRPRKDRRASAKSIVASRESAAKSISVRGLRKDWRQVKAMVARGAKIVVTDNGAPIMQLVPIEHPILAKFDWVAHLQEIGEIAGGRTTGGNAVIEERAAHKY
jgi:antitoxin (DNA-binding transcriptional repressor) of toxin-antitoxin stability system